MNYSIDWDGPGERDHEREHPRPKGIKVTEADIGRAVVYRTAPNFEPEQGVITSFNDKYVFVRYGSGIRGVATDPADLDWLATSKSDAQRAFEKAMAPRENPLHPMFRDHNCSWCRSGERPCKNGNPSQCDWPRARND